MESELDMMQRERFEDEDSREDGSAKIQRDRLFQSTLERMESEGMHSEGHNIGDEMTILQRGTEAL